MSWFSNSYTSIVDKLCKDFANLKDKLENVAEEQFAKSKQKAFEAEQHAKEAAKATAVAKKIGEIIS